MILERKMKAEEEDVDIDSFVVATSPPIGGFAGGPTTSSTSRAQSVSVDPHTLVNGTPKPTGTPSTPNTNSNMNGNANAHGHGHPTPSTDSETNGSGIGTGDDGRMVVETNNTSGVGASATTDPDTLWAEEDPDDDVPGGWRMKVLIEEDEDE